MRLATILFPIGAVAIAIAFAAHVGHAVSSRTAAARSPRPQPGDRAAGLGRRRQRLVRRRADGRGRRRSRTAPLGLAPTPLGRAARSARLGFAALARVPGRCAALVVGRGPWGNMFEFSVAFATSITGGYLVPASGATRSARSASSRPASRSPSCSTRRACRRRSASSCRRSRTRR